MREYNIYECMNFVETLNLLSTILHLSEQSDWYVVIGWFEKKPKQKLAVKMLKSNQNDKEDIANLTHYLYKFIILFSCKKLFAQKNQFKVIPNILLDLCHLWITTTLDKLI